MQLHADKQAPAADFSDQRACDLAQQPIMKYVPELLRAVHQLLRPRRRRSPRSRPRSQADCRRTSSRASPGSKTPRIASSAATAEIGNTPPPSALPMIYISGTTCSQSHANSLPVRPKPVWISSATSSTCRCAAQFPRLPQEAVRRNDDPGFALDRLHQECGRIRRDRRLQRVDIAVRDDFEAGRERPEVRLVFVGGREGRDRDRPAVEIAAADDDFRLVRRHPLHAGTPSAAPL